MKSYYIQREFSLLFAMDFQNNYQDSRDFNLNNQGLGIYN